MYHTTLRGLPVVVRPSRHGCRPLLPFGVGTLFMGRIVTAGSKLSCVARCATRVATAVCFDNY